MTSHQHAIGPVVDAAWLTEHRSEVVVADVRWYLDERSGRAAFGHGHVPGAVFVDLDRWLAAPASPAAGRHPLPSPEVFAEGMRSVGIADDTTVVAYDDAGGVIAARLVWMLRATGHVAAFLDGGLAAWPGELEASAETPDPTPDAAPVAFTAAPWPEDRIAGIDELSARSAVVLDAREAERYSGEVEPVDARAGHIPGARSLPTRGHLTEQGTLAPIDALRERFSAVGVTGEQPVVAYCGSGVTACHTLLVQEHAGLGVGRLYPGSWSQYAADPARPVATGDEPG